MATREAELKKGVGVGGGGRWQWNLLEHRMFNQGMPNTELILNPFRVL